MVGVTIAVAGIAMLALPGPGWAAIFIGLAVLASEFAFAQRLRDRAMHRVRSARSRAQDPEWRRRYRTRIAVLVVAVVLVVAALVWWWVGRYGWTLRPVISLP